MILSAIPTTTLRRPTGGRLLLPRDVYLSASMNRREEMRRFARELRRYGLRSTASWVTDPTDTRRPQWRREAAVQDVHDLDAAGVVIAFTEIAGQYTTGGRHVELGYALAQHKPVIVIGPVENVFHEHPLTVPFPDAQAFLRALEIHP